MLLTTETVARLAGMEVAQLLDWSRTGVVHPPERHGHGRGRGYRFTPGQAVGVCIGRELQRTVRGASLTHIARVIDCLSNKSLDWLQRRIDRGDTHFVTAHHGEPLFSGDEYDRVALQPIVRNVRGAVLEAEKAEAVAVD
jgi:hypothetical protein